MSNNKKVTVNNSAQFGRMQLQHLSLSKLFQLGDHLFVEHPAIDAQHKAIFCVGTNVYENWRDGGSLDVLRPALEKLTNLMHSHFSFEERVLGQIGYEDLKNHAAEHRTMRDELSSMHDRLHSFQEGQEIREGSVLAPGWSIMQFILGFTVGHVAHSDMGYNQALVASRHLASAITTRSIIKLAKGKTLRVDHPLVHEIVCLRGSLWVRIAGQAQDIDLKSGGSHIFPHAGALVLDAMEDSTFRFD